jgi:hypothetical protein
MLIAALTDVLNDDFNRNTFSTIDRKGMLDSFNLKIRIAHDTHRVNVIKRHEDEAKKAAKAAINNPAVDALLARLGDDPAIAKKTLLSLIDERVEEKLTSKNAQQPAQAGMKAKNKDSKPQAQLSKEAPRSQRPKRGQQTQDPQKPSTRGQNRGRGSNRGNQNKRKGALKEDAPDEDNAPTRGTPRGRPRGGKGRGSNSLRGRRGGRGNQ